MEPGAFMQEDQTPFLMPKRVFFGDDGVKNPEQERSKNDPQTDRRIFIHPDGDSGGSQEAPTLKTKREDQLHYRHGYRQQFQAPVHRHRPGYPGPGNQGWSLGGEAPVARTGGQGGPAAFEKVMRAKQEESRKGIGEKNKKEGEVFLAANKAKEGVKPLQRAPIQGDQARNREEASSHGYGDGQLPGDADRWHRVRQLPPPGKTGHLSGQRGHPGWTEALQLMEEGPNGDHHPLETGLWRTGRRAGDRPERHADFEVELISIQEKK